MFHRYIDHYHSTRNVVVPNQIDVETNKLELKHTITNLLGLIPWYLLCFHAHDHPLIAVDNVLGTTKSFIAFHKLEFQARDA